MFPFLNILGRTISVYGLLLVTAGSAAWLLAFGLAKIKKGAVQPLDASLAFLMGVCGGLVGSIILRPLMRLVGLIFVRPEGVFASVNALFSYLVGGFEVVFYGGLLGGLVAILLYCRQYKVNFMSLLDLFAPAIALGHAIGRLGCYFAGCCYGMELPAGHPLAVIYPPVSLAAPAGVPLLAVPLLEAAFLAALCVILVVLCLKANRPGLCFGVYLVAYSCWRFVIEFFRADAIRGADGWLTTSQYISIALFVLGIIYFLCLRRLTKAKSV